MDLGELWRLDATAQAALVRRGEVSAREMVEAAIARIDALNPSVHAMVSPFYERARAQAEEVDLTAPFAGVPLLVKDACLQIEGTPYYAGARPLRDTGYRSRVTTELARRFEAAGFMIVGKTNVPELSSGVTTEPAGFEPTRNPWDLGRTAGGSSGGSAAAVASGMVAIAHGSDAGGSLRYPAACCGVATLKPSRGAVPSCPPFGDQDVLGAWAEFAIARSVRDLGALFDVVADDAPQTPFRARPRAGLLSHDAMSRMQVDDACVRAVESCGRVLDDLGWEVEAAHPQALDDLFIRTMPSFAALIANTRAQPVEWIEHAIGRKLVAGDLSPEVFPGPAATLSPESVAAAVAQIEREAAAIAAWWGEYDLLVTPTVRQPAWPLGQKGGAQDAGTFPFPFTMTGQPAVSLPLGWSTRGLPVGVQLVAAHGADRALLALSAELEQAAPWDDRWPAIAMSR